MRNHDHNVLKMFKLLLFMINCCRLDHRLKKSYDWTKNEKCIKSSITEALRGHALTHFVSIHFPLIVFKLWLFPIDLNVFNRDCGEKSFDSPRKGQKEVKNSCKPQKLKGYHGKLTWHTRKCISHISGICLASTWETSHLKLLGGTRPGMNVLSVKLILKKSEAWNCSSLLAQLNRGHTAATKRTQKSLVMSWPDTAVSAWGFVRWICLMTGWICHIQFILINVLQS